MTDSPSIHLEDNVVNFERAVSFCLQRSILDSGRPTYLLIGSRTQSFHQLFLDSHHCFSLLFSSGSREAEPCRGLTMGWRCIHIWIASLGFFSSVSCFFRSSCLHRHSLTTYHTPYFQQPSLINAIMRRSILALLIPLLALPDIVNAQGLGSNCVAFDGTVTGPSAQCTSRTSILDPSNQR